MPLYEFRCRKCNHQFETIVFASDTEPVTCPKCKAKKPERLLSIFSSGAGEGDGGSSLSSSCSSSSRGFS